MHPASTWGFPGTAYFDVSPGGACLFSLNIQGEILSSTISKAPSNGRLNMVNVSTYTYTPNPASPAQTRSQLRRQEET
jgi:hypothetical protein